MEWNRDSTRVSTKFTAEEEADRERQFLECMALELMEAAAKGDTRAVMQLAAVGVDVNTRCCSSVTLDFTALHFAAKGGRTDTIRELLKMGCRIDGRTPWGFTPFLFAVDAAGLDQTAALLLLRAGSDVNAASWCNLSALHSAARNGHSDVVRELLLRGAGNHVSNKRGESPLLIQHSSVQRNRSPHIVQQLLVYDASVSLNWVAL